MNPRLPRITAKELKNVLKKLGFKLARSSGSHHILINKNRDSRYDTISRR